MSSVDSMVHNFRAQAEAVSTILEVMAAPVKALEYAVQLCEGKEPCQLLVSGSSADPSNKAEELASQKLPKIIAAPALPKTLHNISIAIIHAIIILYFIPITPSHPITIW